MKTSRFNPTQVVRIATQIIFFLLFIVLFFFFGKMTIGFFWFDPLILISYFISIGLIFSPLLLSVIPLLLTFVFGRFFCGWICPFGTLNQFFTWLFRKNNRRKNQIPQNILNIKYFILLAFILSSLMGLHILGWFDPFSLFSRSLAVLKPAGVQIINTVFPEYIKPITDFTTKNIPDNLYKVSGQPFLTGVFFIFLIGMNFYFRRFFCNVLCPLGALYGLISKFSFLNIKTTNNCTSCKACAKSCTYNGNPETEYIKSECITCYNCHSDCNLNAVKTNFNIPKKNNRTPLNLGRRKIMSTAIAGLAAASLSKVSIEAKPEQRRFILRPPGSVNEKDFLDKCIRCGQCVQSCPTGYIQPAYFNYGIENFLTPVLNTKAGYCLFECNRCTPVCPTGAIKELSLKEKKTFKTGTALIDKNSCFTYSDGINCTVCMDKCPLPKKALATRNVETWNYKGKKVVVNQVYVLPDLCTGCGICENVCPRKDRSAISMTPEEEVRELPGSFY